ncbi:MAG: nucleoside triphosphate pyrophosphohydrolase [Porticoccaceae bacterium]|nr:nucleoside triphosphate pyrophosphohydrolase [Porticoccaceae bacterium]
MTDRTLYTIEDLLFLMARLRDPQTGCPWDCAQDYQSLVAFTLEEAYEVADTIERCDYQHLPEELGDLLFQVVFYAQLGKEQAQFDFSTIVDGITAKLISRHPHVFPLGTLASRRSEQKSPEQAHISAVWEEKKREERSLKGQKDLLADIPPSLPALVRAQKIQKRAAKVGFDWPDIRGVIDKLYEELHELKIELDNNHQAAIEEELGDVLFTLVNLARHLDIDAETSLRRATRKFERRFALVDEAAAEEGHSLAELSPQDLNDLWQKAKTIP